MDGDIPRLRSEGKGALRAYVRNLLTCWPSRGVRQEIQVENAISHSVIPKFRSSPAKRRHFARGRNQSFVSRTQRKRQARQC